MADARFQTIIEHPEKREIITKLVTGETPKSISIYLKNKYKGDDEKHLRLSAAVLKDFIDSYGATYGFADTIVKKNNESKLDKEIAESLLQNKEWQERIAEVTDEEVDLKRKLKQVLCIIEARTEQLFDLIQARPENTKNDYILNKNLELLVSTIEKCDKIFNDKPDIKIEHTYTIQMVEQQSAALQEAVRKVLNRMSPELVSPFMDAVQDEFSKIKPEYRQLPSEKTFNKDVRDIDVLLHSGEQLGELIDDEIGEFDAV